MDYTNYFANAAKATRKIINLAPAVTNQVLHDLASMLILKSEDILIENGRDLDRMDANDPKYDRLKLTEGRIRSIADDIVHVAELESPLGEILSEQTMPNGLNITKLRVALGVVGVIYEARPNVTLDVFALCFKTGNVCILKGGSDADFSNRILIQIVYQVLTDHQVDKDIVTLLPVEREATDALLNASGYVDVLIPRGSQQLISHVRKNSKVPVIETGAGIVHTFFDESADLEKGAQIIFNAKTRRVSVCNALDCLLIHSARLNDLPALAGPMAAKQVEIFADDTAFEHLTGYYPAELLKHAKTEHFGTEFLSFKIAIKTVKSITEALDHISAYGSKHSEAIVSENAENIAVFLNTVDAAAVYANASTAFTDGAQFGLGAEIGISTQKLHARGPMGLKELTSYKWVVKGNGQIRNT